MSSAIAMVEMMKTMVGIPSEGSVCQVGGIGSKQSFRDGEDD